jgi:hypothetical protein
MAPGQWFCLGYIVGALSIWCLVGCASEADQRRHWQDCGGIVHEECWEDGSPYDARACEYVYYQECINGS